jgi:hypothetical protein
MTEEQKNIDLKMLTDQEMLELIKKVANEYTGLSGGLMSSIGVLVMSKLFGWRVTRLISSESQWRAANKNFGDIKIITPERGELAHKSVGLAVADKLGSYWKYMRGLKIGTTEQMSEKTRKMIIE